MHLGTGADEEQVAVPDAGIDHAVAAHFQKEVSGSGFLFADGFIAQQLLIGEHVIAGLDRAQHRLFQKTRFLFEERIDIVADQRGKALLGL